MAGRAAPVGGEKVRNLATAGKIVYTNTDGNDTGDELKFRRLAPINTITGATGTAAPMHRGIIMPRQSPRPAPPIHNFDDNFKKLLAAPSLLDYLLKELTCNDCIYFMTKGISDNFGPRLGGTKIYDRHEAEIHTHADVAVEKNNVRWAGPLFFDYLKCRMMQRAMLNMLEEVYTLGLEIINKPENAARKLIELPINKKEIVPPFPPAYNYDR